MLIEVAMQSRSTVQFASKGLAVHAEFINRVCLFILDHIEITVVAIAWNNVPILFVPLRELDPEVFCQFCCFYDQPCSLRKSPLAREASSNVSYVPM